MLVLFVLLSLATRWSHSHEVCQVCDCLPSADNPVQAFCTDNGFSDKELWLTTVPRTRSLQLVYISGVKTVNFDQNAFQTENPLDLLVQNCSNILISDYSLTRLRSLVIRDVNVTRLGVLRHSELWSVTLTNIKQLTVDDSSFEAKYLVKIGNIGSLTITSGQEERRCDNSELRFTLSYSKLNQISEGGLTICGNQAKLEGNMFRSIVEGGFQITAETIRIIDNHFDLLSKRAFNLTGPEIYMSGNWFETLPAGALSDVSTLQDTFFTNNTIRDIDLGGVLLDMGWEMTIEHNTIVCDCASKRTSILHPKQDMLLLTNASHETLQNIFLNNYCNLNCTVTLRAFSQALIQGDVCLTNKTQLEEEKLCDVTISPDYQEGDETDNSLVSGASRVEFLVPLSIIVVTLFITSSICYGYKEMKTFKFVFDPNRSSVVKLPTE